MEGGRLLVSWKFSLMDNGDGDGKFTIYNGQFTMKCKNDVAIAIDKIPYPISIKKFEIAKETIINCILYFNCQMSIVNCPLNYI